MALDTVEANLHRHQIEENPCSKISKMIGNPRARIALTIGAMIATVALSGCKKECPEYQKTEYQFIKENIDFPKGQPALKTAREKEVFLEREKWKITASSKAFHDMAKRITQSPDLQEVLHQEEIKILYPAAGMHLSPLELAFEFAEHSTTLKKVEFTYTEIDDKSDKMIGSMVERLVIAHPNLHNYKLVQTDISEEAHRKTITFTYKTSDQRNIQITINYEFKMSGEDFFRKESAKESDFFISHDIGAGESSATKAVLVFIGAFQKEWDQKPHYLLVEYLGPNNRRIEYEGMGNIVAVSKGHNYGCGENHFDEQPNRKPVFNQSAVIKLDTKALSYIAENGGNELVSQYAIEIAHGTMVDPLHEAVDKSITAEKDTNRWKTRRIIQELSDKSNNPKIKIRLTKGLER